MTDPTDSIIRFENDAMALKEANALNKTAVFDALSAAGITTVAVVFDGEGDSGQIQDISAQAMGEPHTIPEIQVQTQFINWGAAKLDAVRTSLTEAIGTLCYEFLNLDHDGWENNDGAFGEFTFDVTAREVRLEFNARFSDFTASRQTF